jgi:uncharacterized protein YecE (DUF72 family)
MTPDIRIGTSGWHYPSGPGRWNGVFYPARRPRGFDELTFYAEYFDFVEVNATFYGQPRAEVSSAWAARTPPGFLFAVKLYQQFTHPRLFRARVERTLAKALGTDDVPEAAIAALAAANQADLDAFRRGIAPLADAGKLGPLLAQFPPSFHDSPDSRVHLAALVRAFAEHDVVVELRHRSWSEHAGETRARLAALGAAWAWIDEPKFKDSVRQPEVPATPFAYLRFHGRNAKAWWATSDHGERYHYLYSIDELRPVARDLIDITSRAHRAFATLNNHPDARAIKNAAELKRLLGQAVPDLPVPLRERLGDLDIEPLVPVAPAPRRAKTLF